MTDPFGICLEPTCHDSEPPKEMPSTLDMAKNLFQTVKDIAGGVANGEGLRVDEDTYEARLRMCLECDRFDKESTRCSECGCYMKVKCMFKKTYCPIDKWEAEND